MPFRPANAEQHRANQKRLEALETGQGEISTKLDQLLTAVVGDESLGTTGLVKRMSSIETRQGRTERRHIFQLGAASVISAFFSGLAAWWAGHKG